MTILDMLKDPFEPKDVEWRACRSGVSKGGKPWVMALAYITNRAIMERLDSVVGPENWRNEYKDAPCGGVLCGLSLRINGEWVTKWDGAENTDVEAVKGGLSGAMKRAGVQWGIGRYLYGLTENFATVVEQREANSHQAVIKTDGGKVYAHWVPPALPGWALPSNQRINREQMQDVIAAAGSAIAEGDRSTMQEVFGELTEAEKSYVWRLFSTNQKSAIRDLLRLEAA